MKKLLTVVACLLFLGFVIAANLIIAEKGPSAVLYVSFLLVGPVLTLRDFLHRQWEDDSRAALWLKMGALVGAGAMLSYIASPDAGDIAKASFIAFAAAGVTDTLIFQVMRWSAIEERVNASNMVSSAVDSLLFPTIAFGSVVLSISMTQWVAKIAGGVVWLLAIRALERASAQRGALTEV